MKNLRVLVFSATFGAGHVRAAEALIESIHNLSAGAEVTHIDCWAVLSKNLNEVFKDFYIGMIKHTPKLWGKFYYVTSAISPDSVFQRGLNNIGQSKYLTYIREFQPDLIICTYPTVAGVLADLRLKQLLDVPLVAVVTDYAVHSQWIHHGVDLYIVGCADICSSFISRGIDPGRIKVTGIPVSSKFERDLNRSEIMDGLGLLPNRPTVLIMGGAYGVLSEMKDLCRTLADTLTPCQSIVVCGQDKNLYESLDELVENAQNPVLRFGYVNNVEELMTAADVIITKAGGLTVSEALTKRLPIIVYKPIPGQEQENALFLEKIGAGITARTRVELEKILLSLLVQPENLEKMRQAAARAVPGQAANLAVQAMLDLVKTTNYEVKVGE
jgi:processive 1,2-diacylglycerol beta-glucosyltransferase